jgi:hypothetical protein
VAALAAVLRVTEGEVRKALSRIREVEKNHGGRIITDVGSGKLVLEHGVADYWKRIEKLAFAYAKDAFSAKRHPLSLGGEEYLTIVDVNTVTLFLLEILLQRARETGTLVIGIAKDTTATDISRAVLPYGPVTYQPEALARTLAAASGWYTASNWQSPRQGSRTTGPSWPS